MKEMTRIRKNHLGGSVKKTLFVMALAMALVFVVAGTAMALPTYGGQNRAGAPATATAVVPVTATETVITGVGTPGVTINGTTFTTGTVTPGSDTLYGAGTNTYENWSLTINYNGNAGTNSPHGNFTTTTVKCVVCHAVHYAAPGGAPAANGNFNNGTQVADTLLRMRADQACVFCHATAGQAVNGTPVYDGIGVAGGLPGSTGGAFNTGHVAGTNCSVCHSSVHGANADHSVASLDGFLLLKLPVSAVGTQAAATSDMLDAIKAVDFQAQNEGFAPGAALGGTWQTYQTTNSSVLREQAVGVFCAECHNGAYATGALGAGAATNIRGSNVAQYTGHRIGVAATTNGWNAGADTVSSSSLTSITIAWKPATNCKSCHDANDVFGNTAFPHSWGGTKMWLLSAADAGAAETAIPYGTAAGSAYNDQSPQLRDGVCLKCHVAPLGTAGVGITF